MAVNKTTNSSVCVKDSGVVGIGKGLFATTSIKKGDIIAEFGGELKTSTDDITDSRSNIYFHDGSVLQCDSTDPASFANDAIDFPKQRRHLMKVLKSDQPFYKKLPGSKINAKISVDTNNHRAYLIAESNIEPDEEIFCHYGFSYWYNQELGKTGFLMEPEIAKNGIPNDIFNYPAFVSYVKEFYPTSTGFKVDDRGGSYDVDILFPNGRHLLIVLEKLSELMQIREKI